MSSATTWSLFQCILRNVILIISLKNWRVHSIYTCLLWLNQVTGLCWPRASCPWCAAEESSLAAPQCGWEAWDHWPHHGCPRIPCPCKGSAEEDSPDSLTATPTQLSLEILQDKFVLDSMFQVYKTELKVNNCYNIKLNTELSWMFSHRLTESGDKIMLKCFCTAPCIMKILLINLKDV